MVGSPARTAPRAPIAAALALAALLFISCDSDSGALDGGDIDPPTVLSTSPAKDAVVPATATVQVVFSEDVDAASAVDGVSVIGVSGTVVYDPTTRTAEFSPDEPFAAGAYTLSVKRVRDMAGNLMVGAETVSFVVR
jgi:hypothetical protein